MKSLLNNEFFARLETLAINLSADLRGFFGGKHRVKTYGQTVEFSDYREYMLGDDIRRIDWNLYSRFEKYFIKLFTDERQMHLQVFLDCSASMGQIESKKAAYALAVGAALGFLSVHNMDKVSFKLLKKSKVEDTGGIIVGKNNFFRAIKALEKIEYKSEVNISEAIAGNPNVGGSDGLSVIISDFFSENDWKKAVDYLLYKKRQVMLVQVVTPEELDPSYSGRTTLLDSEAGGMEDLKNLKINITRGLLNAYEEALEEYNQEIKEFCNKRGVSFITVSCDQPLEQVLFKQLLKVGVMS
ncbi:MAG: DUF58 domain-containing protein [Firmicutes bacterium]|nr:DUF58 domain-containing protein [Bacillota bacterium]